MRPVHRGRAVLALRDRALAQGGFSLGLTSFEWDVARGCQAPVYRQIHGRMDRNDYQERPDSGAPGVYGDLWVPCRRCPTCLRHKARLWAARARAEYGVAERNWFGTLTLTPERQMNVLHQARARAAARGYDFDSDSEHRQFAGRVEVVGEELTRYLKRIRKRSGARLRYLAVAERHKTGAPHLHVLVHEVSPVPVRWADLSDCWHWGFTKWNLADAKAVGYVVKYLTKQVDARVRASLRYGRTHDPLRVTKCEGEGTTEELPNIPAISSLVLPKE